MHASRFKSPPALAVLCAVALASCASPNDAWQKQFDAARTQQRREEEQRRLEHDQWRRDVAASKVPPSAADLANADYGPPPSDGWETTLADHIRENLKDPDSARFHFGNPEKGWARCREGGSYVFLWECPCEVNAKNSFGGYEGFKAERYWYRNGEWLTFGRITAIAAELDQSRGH